MCSIFRHDENGPGGSGPGGSGPEGEGGGSGPRGSGPGGGKPTGKGRGICTCILMIFIIINAPEADHIVVLNYLSQGGSQALHRLILMTFEGFWSRRRANRRNMWDSAFIGKKMHFDHDNRLAGKYDLQCKVWM